MKRLALALAIAIPAMPAFAADPAWHGRWAIDPIACTTEGDTAETAPLYARATSLRWFVADCQVRKVSKAGSGVRIEARCGSEGTTKTIEVLLEPKGDRLGVVWDGSRVKDMRRCAP